MTFAKQRGTWFSSASAEGKGGGMLSTIGGRRFLREAHVQVVDLGKAPDDQKLSSQLKFIPGENIQAGRTRLLYEWRSTDGLEDQENPRTQRPWGPILQRSLSDLMQPDNWARYLKSLKPWLRTWVLPDEASKFDGLVVVDDFEHQLLEWYQSDISVPQEEREKLAREWPTVTRAEMLQRFVTETNRAIRAYLPRARVGWYGAGGCHPGHTLWTPGYWEDMKRSAARDSAMIQLTGAACPVFYWPRGVPDRVDRDEIRRRVLAVYEAAWGAGRIRDGFAYVAVRKEDEPFSALTEEEVLETYSFLFRAGINKSIIWNVLQTQEDLTQTQDFIDKALRPALRRLGAIEGVRS